jgi:hypothetical protein
MSNSSNFLSLMVKESEAYASMDIIESLIEKGVSLHHVPLQPLYLAIKSLPVEQVSSYLTRLSSEQRSLMQDLDLWHKDDLDPNEFEFWIQSYASCMDDDVRSEFANGIEFLLYLKGRFNIWTFDAEDPLYPDHDNYFLSDDGLLLFEFDENFGLVGEVRALIREIYSVMGVENAYSWLFKMISDAAFSMLEEEYQAKKDRLADAGFVDYFDALEIDNSFINLSFLEAYLRKKKAVSVGVGDFSRQQVLPKNALKPFENSFGSFDAELAKVSDPKRKEYLQFNFLRLVNGNIALKGDFKDGSISIHRASEKTKCALLVGFDYVISHAIPHKLLVMSKGDSEEEREQCLFDILDFTELFKIGNSLYRFVRADLKKHLKSSALDAEEAFCGKLISEFLDNSFEEVPQYSSDFEEKAESVVSFKTYKSWSEDTEMICALLPFIGKLAQTFKPLKESAQIQDHFYLNYNVDDIDAEAIFLSSFACTVLVEKGDLSMEVLNAGKLGLTIDEFRSFSTHLVSNDGLIAKKVEAALSRYQEQFGMGDVPRFSRYFFILMSSQLEGYDYKNLGIDDFAHVGGPIILTPKSDLS